MANGAKIGKTEAATLTRNFREAAAKGAISFDDGLGNTLLGQVYDQAVFEALKNQTGYAGIRIYYGLNSNEKFCLVLVGVDGNGNDISEGDIFEYGGNCPPNCGASSPLNS